MIDKILYKRWGYGLEKENEHGATYAKLEYVGANGNWVHTINIGYKVYCNDYLIQSYDESVINTTSRGYINQVAGVEAPAVILLWLKSRIMKIKYRKHHERIRRRYDQDK